MSSSTDRWAADLLDDAIAADGDVVTRVDSGSIPGAVYYQAMRVRNSRAWFACIGVMTDPETPVDGEPRLTLRWCAPDATAPMLREWSLAATGSNPAPKDLGTWRSIRAVTDAAIRLFDREAP